MYVLYSGKTVKLSDVNLNNSSVSNTSSIPSNINTSMDSTNDTTLNNTVLNTSVTMGRTPRSLRKQNQLNTNTSNSNKENGIVGKTVNTNVIPSVNVAKRYPQRHTTEVTN